MNPHSFVTTIDLKLADKLLRDLPAQGFEMSTPPHTIFSAKKKGVICTLYQSGKMVVQGKDRGPFLEFYLEPEVLGSFEFSHPMAALDTSPRIGIDESGKGDFFGPLCIAGVFAKEEDFSILKEIGVKDSKSISDGPIRKIAQQIKSRLTYHVVRINPPKYNELYSSFGNLNRLLAWGHATTIEALVEKSGCRRVIIDQFANEQVVINALERKKLELDLTQRHRGEEDLVVAAASILARQAFLDGLDHESKLLGLTLPKGGGEATIQIGKQIVRDFGVAKLRTVCKQHFKNLDAILGSIQQ